MASRQIDSKNPWGSLEGDNRKGERAIIESVLEPVFELSEGEEKLG